MRGPFHAHLTVYSFVSEKFPNQMGLVQAEVKDRLLAGSAKREVIGRQVLNESSIEKEYRDFKPTPIHDLL
jgi:hypothetical protein